MKLWSVKMMMDVDWRVMVMYYIDKLKIRLQENTATGKLSRTCIPNSNLEGVVHAYSCWTTCPGRIVDADFPENKFNYTDVPCNKSNGRKDQEFPMLYQNAMQVVGLAPYPALILKLIAGQIVWNM